MLSSEVAAEGLDLQFASCLVNYDLPWNPARVEQRIGRIDRIGQKEDKILIFNFIYQDTIEDKIFYRLYERHKLFERALGTTGELLGKKINQITRQLFKHNLTDEELEDQLRASVFAQANREFADNEAQSSSMIYELIKNQMEKALSFERYVTDKDLVDYVKDFCKQGNSKLVESAKNPNNYELILSEKDRVDFQEYLRQVPQLETQILRIEKIILRFSNKPQLNQRGIEVVSQNHPLIRFISSRYDPSKNSLTSAIEYHRGDDELSILKPLKSGLYAYRVECWSYGPKGKSNRTKVRLGYSLTNINTGEIYSEDIAECLINKAVRFGISLDSALANEQKNEGADRKNWDHLEDLEEKFICENREKISLDAEFKIHQFEVKIKEYQRDLKEGISKKS